MNAHFSIVILALSVLAIFTLFSLKKESKNSYSMPLTSIGIIIFLSGILLGYDTFSKP